MSLLGKKKSILNYQKLKEISIQSSLIHLDGPFLVQKTNHNKQLLKASDSFEKNLFKDSSRFFSFKETVIVRVKTKQGISFDSELLRGESSSFKNLKLIQNQIHELDFKVRKNSFDVDYFEIIHTHPTGCYLEKDGEYDVVTLGGLSSSDYEVADYFRNKFECDFKLKAVCPGGITYCSV